MDVGVMNADGYMYMGARASDGYKDEGATPC